jgi:hypothetical protein
MRSTLILIIGFITLGLFLWVSLSGIMLLWGGLGLVLFLVVSVGYTDTALLFLLGSRELRSSDEKAFFEAASQEAYKLSVQMPRLYFYNGSLERAFIFQNNQTVSIVLNKQLLSKASPDELKAICFELLLQVKKGMATKRTKSMFMLGFIIWSIHSVMGLFLRILPFKDIKSGADWFINYLCSPFLDFLFKIILGTNYFKKLKIYIHEYPAEKELLDRLGFKLRKPHSYYSLASRKILELQAINKSKNFQNIMALEFLPHEWDYLFEGLELKSAK